MQTTKHAIAAGMGAPVRLCSARHHIPGRDPQGLSNQKETARHHYGRTAVIENQHLDFAANTHILQLQNTLATLPGLVARFGCGVEHDLHLMTTHELMGLHAHLKTFDKGPT